MAESGQFEDVLLRRPLLLVLAGPNGAGKTTFFQAHLAAAGLRFVNADRLARELELDARQGAAAADALRAELIRQGESFITETVFSDPVGAKLEVFTRAMAQGYTVVLIYIGVSGHERSDERVAMRVSQGGHDVPPDRLIARYPRTLANLHAALPLLSAVVVYDNDDLGRPYRLVARVVQGVVVDETPDPPAWWRGCPG
ncbi:MAG: zeta toxin family protein [Planctomycetes bacterium]|nr:zeta toxin family protein [Planctomycetota bacterium]